nr:hypothetical protein GCM10020063_085390 [Dactylosporangium thailandense]
MSWRRRGTVTAGVLLLLIGITTAPSAPAAAAPKAPPKPAAVPVPVPANVTSAVAKGPTDVLVAVDPSAGIARIRAATKSGYSTSNRTTAAQESASALATVKSAVLGAAGSGVHVQTDYGNLPVQLVRVDSPSALSALAASAGVRAIALPGVNHRAASSDLELIRQPAAVSSGYTGSGVTVAVLDTGIDLNGTGSAFGNCSGGVNTGTCKVRSFADTAGGASTIGDADPQRHGTNVAGLVTTVAPASKVAVYRVFTNDNGDLSAPDQAILNALNAVAASAASANIRAVNLSLGDSTYWTTTCTGSVFGPAFRNLRALGVVPVVAAGNDAMTGGFHEGVSSPACADGALTVGAVWDHHLSDDGPYTEWTDCGTQSASAADAVACFSQTGDRLDVLAPGVLVTGAGITMSGTSQATPHVAGAIADLISARSNATSDQVVHALRSTGPLVTDPRDQHIVRHRLDIPDAAASLVNAGPPAEVSTPGCTTNSLPANDDGSTSAVTLPFVADFYGTNYSSLYVNNNGNVTFRSPQVTYTPFTINASVPPIIAPFFADVDTRGPGSSLVTYGTTTFGSRSAFCVDWNNVGYFTGHTDKLNSFQLLMVDRGDVGAGDFDIVMNYDNLSWETGDASGGYGGYGGTPAGAGYSAGDGNPAHFFQLPGSLAANGLLDGNPSTGLVNGSRNSLQKGRYIFEIRNGNAPGGALITGVVKDSGGTPLAGATVQACPATGSCLIGFSGGDGTYTIVGVSPGPWTLTAFPPSGFNGLPGHAGPVTVTTGATVHQDIVLAQPQGPPPGTTITNHGSTGSVPIILWTDDLSLDTTGCAGATVTYQMRLAGSTVRSGGMTETPAGSGHYHATVPSLYPVHGDAQVSIAVDCPSTPDQHIDFDIYIDPSGTVVDIHGNPVSGATVTLLRADTEAGPFLPVPDQSAVMSPSNRSNPVTTGADGGFHWDVLAGFYRLSAAKTGCRSPGTGEDVSLTDVYEIPPPALGIQIRLDCDPLVPGSFVTLPPARILDTRNAVGVGTTTAVPAFGSVTLTVAGQGGVPASGVSAVMMNVTVTQTKHDGYVTAYPSGTTRPVASNLNFVANQTVPNLVTVKLGGDGKVVLYNGSADTLHLVADVAGYFRAGTPTAPGTFASLTPTRILDTRNAVGVGTTTAVPAFGSVTLTVAGQGGVPASGVSAVMMNVTVTQTKHDGYVTAYPSGTTRPVASNLNFVANQTVPNLVTVKLGGDGKAVLYNGSADTLHLVADVAGYFLAGTPTLPGTFVALSPTRILDTRDGTGVPAAGLVPNFGSVQLGVAGHGGVPAGGAVAVMMNVTVAQTGHDGFVTVYPNGIARPVASNLNFGAGTTVPNLVTVRIGTSGEVVLYNGSDGTCRMVADVSGYFRS